jgi:hypothetical protein
MPSWACLQGRGWTQIRPPALKFYLNGNSNVSQMISDGDTQHPPPPPPPCPRPSTIRRRSTRMARRLRADSRNVGIKKALGGFLNEFGVAQISHHSRVHALGR